MTTQIDREAIEAAYEDVRNDFTETLWAVFKFDGHTIVHDSSGIEYYDFQRRFLPDERAFGFIRTVTEDEGGKRSKFALITWVGPQLSTLQRAKMSTDKALVKAIVENFAVEITTSELDELEERNIQDELHKAGRN